MAKKKVSIRRITKDRYGRTVAELFKDGVDIQKFIVKEGFGRYTKNMLINVNGVGDKVKNSFKSSCC